MKNIAFQPQRVFKADDLLIKYNMKYLLIFLAFSATTLYADTYQGKNGKVAHNRAGTAVQTSNGSAVHARGSGQATAHQTGSNTATTYKKAGTTTTTHAATADTVRAGSTTAVRTGGSAAVVHTDSNWNSAYWQTNKYGYWNGQRGFWHVVSGQHVFVVVN
jgi:hypothetical protein